MWHEIAGLALVVFGAALILFVYDRPQDIDDDREREEDDTSRS